MGDLQVNMRQPAPGRHLILLVKLCSFYAKETIYFHYNSERSFIIIILHLNWGLFLSMKLFKAFLLHSGPGSLFPEEKRKMSSA
jgi:hypothetical protein